MCSDLFPRIAAGENGAIEECLLRFGNLIRTMALRSSSNCSEVEELVQEIFIALWRHAHRFDAGIAAEHIFVTMVARRRLIDFQRKRQRAISTMPMPDDLPLCRTTVEDSLALNEEAVNARRNLARLPPIERKVIELTIEDGLSHLQIAVRLDIPLGTVKSSVRRGLIRLRELTHQR